jgi:hypothetical protein
MHAVTGCGPSFWRLVCGFAGVGTQSAFSRHHRFRMTSPCPLCVVKACQQLFVCVAVGFRMHKNQKSQNLDPSCPAVHQCCSAMLWGVCLWPRWVAILMWQHVFCTAPRALHLLRARLAMLCHCTRLHIHDLYRICVVATCQYGCLLYCFVSVLLRSIAGF